MITLDGKHGSYAFDPKGSYVPGGTGKVYRGRVVESRADQVPLDGEVAVKVLYRHLAESLTNVHRERETAELNVEHPNLLPIYDFVEYQGINHTVSQWLEGEVLSTKLERLERAQSTLPHATIERVIDAVTAGLDALHTADPPVVHRDVKPSNIMMCDDGRIVLLDLGIAKILKNQRQTRTGIGALMGSLPYAPPEQIRGELNRICQASDIYSLGITIYELFTGEMPFRGTDFELMKLQVHAPLPLHPKLPKKYVVLTQRCCQKNPDQRFRDAAAFRRFSRDYAAHRYVRLPGRILPLRTALLAGTAAATVLLLLVLNVSQIAAALRSDPRTTTPAAVRPALGAPPLAARPDSTAQYYIRAGRWHLAIGVLARDIVHEPDTGRLVQLQFCTDSLLHQMRHQ